MQEVTENMKFNKKLTYNGVLNIPTEALRLSGIPEEARVEIHALNGAVVVLKERMTAMELIRALDAIHQLEVDLTVHLSKVCGFCQKCEGGCPLDNEEDDIHLPQDLRDEAGIPAGAKLSVSIDDEEHNVIIGVADYSHDLRDVPDYMLEMLKEGGLCLLELEEHLVTGDTVYGA